MELLKHHLATTLAVSRFDLALNLSHRERPSHVDRPESQPGNVGMEQSESLTVLDITASWGLGGTKKGGRKTRVESAHPASLLM